MSKYEEMQALKKEIFSSLHCALPGIIESYDSASQCANIRIAVKSKNGIDYPVLQAVPVFMPVGSVGGDNVEYMVSVDDWCLVIFSDVSLDRWLSTGEEAAPMSGRMHDLSDGFAFVGFKPAGGGGE